uniref:NADH dehydrogenase subunit 6 n=1 Tax=Saldoida armata TaxID=2715442 RepID=UPI002E79AA13|nr:NADH dehydrogenase subunit 6 [Saldoida armata]WQB61747.1 NADH dehydrogenase subunit 6 [Saldoida armata]
MYTTMLMMTLTTVMFTITKHPLSMGITLIAQTLLVSVMTGMMMNSFWFSYMLLMIVLSGMLVLFVYMASIASNEKFKSSVKNTKMMMISITIIIIWSVMIDVVIKNNINMEKICPFMENEQTNMLSKMFSTQNMKMTLMMILYLLFTMIVVSYNTNIFEGPMRKTN